MGEALALLALFLFAANVFTVRLASPLLGQQLGFLVALVANVVVAGLLFGGRLLLSDARFALDWYAVLLFGIAGFFANYLGRRGFFLSIDSLGPSRASAVQATVPLFGVVLAWVFLGEVLAAADAVAILLVILGLALTSRSTAAAAPGGPPTRVVVLAVGVALISAASYSVGAVFRSAALDDWQEPVFGGLVGAAVGTVAYIVLHGPLRGALSALRATRPLGIGLWLGSGALTVSAQIAMIAAMHHLPVGPVLAISSALPVVVIPVSLLLLRRTETVGWTTVLGAGAVVCGVGVLLLR
ncbi:MAG TPA: DMT family transporter [Mycobacteriales bacterium]|nr:DMT family transporter [Mycobacteriales bacterium]